MLGGIWSRRRIEGVARGPKGGVCVARTSGCPRTGFPTKPPKEARSTAGQMALPSLPSLRPRRMCRRRWASSPPAVPAAAARAVAAAVAAAAAAAQPAVAAAPSLAGALRPDVAYERVSDLSEPPCATSRRRRRSASRSAATQVPAHGGGDEARGERALSASFNVEDYGISVSASRRGPTARRRLADLRLRRGMTSTASCSPSRRASRIRCTLRAARRVRAKCPQPSRGPTPSTRSASAARRSEHVDLCRRRPRLLRSDGARVPAPSRARPGLRAPPRRRGRGATCARRRGSSTACPTSTARCATSTGTIARSGSTS